MNGASLAEIAEVLGHKTLQMVKRYAHAYPTGVAKGNRGILCLLNFEKNIQDGGLLFIVDMHLKAIVMAFFIDSWIIAKYVDDSFW